MESPFDDLEPDSKRFVYDPIPNCDEELLLSFDRYIAEGIGLLEEWLRDRS